MSDDEDDWEKADMQVAVSRLPAKFDGEQEQVDLDEMTAVESSKPRREGEAKPKPKTFAQLKAEDDKHRSTARPMTEEERLAEQLRVRKLQEDADADLAKDLFDAHEPKEVKPAVETVKKVVKAGNSKSALDSLELTNHKQAVDLATIISGKLETKKATMSFLKEVLKRSAPTLASEEVNELITMLKTIESKTKAKSTTNKVKPKLNMSGLDKPGGERDDMDDVDDRGRRGGYSGYDDYDFM